MLASDQNSRGNPKYLALLLLLSVSGGRLLDGLLGGSLACGLLGSGGLAGGGGGLLLKTGREESARAREGGRPVDGRTSAAWEDLGAMVKLFVFGSGWL